MKRRTALLCTLLSSLIIVAAVLALTSVTSLQAASVGERTLGDLARRGPLALAACPTDLFISEYIEGSSNNKALEIYNGTGAAITFSNNYTVGLFSNGSATVGSVAVLSGTLAAGDVYIIANAGANAAILAQADMTSTVTYFNGDDALALYHNGVIIDAFGQIGFDPGSEWGTGLASTLDNTLVRKSSIIAGDPIGSDVFSPSIEWDGYAVDTTSYLGAHTMDPCQTVLEADLGLSKSGPTAASAGDTITYTIHVSNTGTASATGTIVTDTLPAEVTFFTYTTALTNAFTQVGNDLIWDFGEVPSNTVDAEILVEAVISPALANGSSFTNFVTGTTTFTDTNTANNSASFKTFIGAPDLVIVKTGPAEVNAGTQVVYTLAYTNTGDLAATNVMVVDQLPAALTYVTDSLGSGVQSGGRITWTLGTLNNNDFGSIVLTATSSTAGNYQNVATISGSPIDSNPLDNASSVTTTVIGADPFVLKSGPANVLAGELITYTLTYGNSGNVTATATLTDQLPTGFAVADIAADTSNLAFTDVGGARVWTTEITPATSVSFTFALTVPASITSGTRFTNTLTVLAAETGDNSADDTATAAATAYQIVPIATARAGAVGQVFVITGTVTAEPGVFTYNGQNRYMYIQDNTGGVLIYRGGGLNAVARNEVVRILGSLDQYKAEIQFVPANASDVKDLGPGAAVTPLVTNTGSIRDPLEGQLVQISGPITGKPAAYRLQVNDGSGVAEAYRYFNLGQITDTHYIDFAPFSVGDYVRVIGVVRTYTESYGLTNEVMPRGPSDIAKYPRVLSTGPLSNATGVSLAATITATFNVTMSNVSGSTFLVQGPGGAVAGTVGYDPATKTAIFTPTAALDANTLYTATLKAALMSDAGLTLMPAQDYVWTFTTRQTAPNLDTSTKTNSVNGAVKAGEWVTYTITLINTGDANATAIITDVLPSYYTVARVLDFTQPTTGTLRWTGVVTAGQSVSVRFVAQVNMAQLPVGTTMLNNSVEVNDGVHAPGVINDGQPPFLTVYGLYLPLIRR